MVKDIIIKPIDSKSAKKIVQIYHYSGKSTQNSQIHFGAFLNDRLEGVLQFGPCIDKNRMATNLGVPFNSFLELNRMAFSDKLPKNSESRCLGICLRILRKQYPFLKVIISFADACQCGDGTIYRASGFKLHSFKKNTSVLVDENGKQGFSHGSKKNHIVAKKTLGHIVDPQSGKRVSALDGFKPIPGYQMKYLFFFDKELEKRFDFVNFKDIPNDVRMYKGKKCAPSVESGTSAFQAEGGSESLTDALQLPAETIDQS